MANTTYTLGRSPDCAVVFADESISRLHAEICLADDDRLFVVDCNSQNGTFRKDGDSFVPVRQYLANRAEILRFGLCDTQASYLISLIQNAAPVRKEPESRMLGKHIRCACGAVRRESATCPVCGKRDA